MNGMSAIAVLTLLLASACSRGGGGAESHGGKEEHSGEEGHEKEGHKDGEEGHKDGEEGHKDEVKISPEALKLADIRFDTAQRRALTGGVAVPAEVQFEPSSTAHVGPLVAGRLTKVSVGLGEQVKRGQLLGVVASSDVSEARSKLAQARARLSAAESTLKRQQQLSSEGIGARRSLIDAEAQVGEIRADVQGLRSQLSVFGSGGGGGLKLVSPIDGVVVALHATLGETASPDRAAFVVTDPTKVWVRGNVPELELSRVKTGSAVVVRLHAFPELTMKGTLSYAAPALDETTRSLPVRVSLERPDARLRGGLFGHIELLGGAADERVLVVPVDAVATLEGQSVVFVPSDEPDTLRPQPVALGRRAGAFIEVRSGLKEGARLAISGAFTLKSALRSGELSEGHAH